MTYEITETRMRAGECSNSDEGGICWYRHVERHRPPCAWDDSPSGEIRWSSPNRAPTSSAVELAGGRWDEPLSHASVSRPRSYRETEAKTDHRAGYSESGHSAMTLLRSHDVTARATNNPYASLYGICSLRAASRRGPCGRLDTYRGQTG
jgi:hypothetical protein